MQAPNAQGIMGLMAQGKTQQPPQPQGQAPQGGMPSPAKSSPMAGLGSVEDRVSAYRGNPAPLQQRYAMGQDLLDLLALQKIKSEKESAARQMQLSMGQQAAAQGMDPPTIAEQREKEVQELTKNELAQQRGDTAGQQVQQQQQNLQQAMSGGIASAPGAATAAQPKMMATGGIVAFQEGGSTLDAARARRRAAYDAVYKFGSRQRQQNPEGFQSAQEELQAAEAALTDAQKAYETEMSATGLDRPATRREDLGAAARFQRAEAQPLPAPVAPVAAPAAVPTPTPTAPAAPVAPAAAPPRPAPPRPAPMPGATSEAGPAPQQAMPGLGGLPGVAKPPGLEESQRQDYSRDPEAAQMAQEERIRKAYALSPEQRAVYEQGIAQRQKMFDETYDPQRMREERISKALMGAGGRRYGVLAGAAQAGLGAAEQQRAARLKDFEGMQRAREGLVGIEREGIKPGIEGGLKALEQARVSRSEGQRGATSVYGTDVQARDRALDREIEKLKVGVQSESNRVAREGLDVSRAQSIYAQATNRVQELERKLDGDFAKEYGMLLMAEQGGKMDPAQKQQLDVARAQLDIKKDQIRKELEPVLASAREKLGVPSSSGWGELKTKK